MYDNVSYKDCGNNKYFSRQKTHEVTKEGTNNYAILMIINVY